MEELELLGLNEKIYYYKTKSGLPIYMWVNDKIKSMYATLSVKYGSIHTKFRVGKKVHEVPNGIAHFLEHIKFNIDENTSAHDEFYKIGGDANAFTTFNYTSYLVMATENKLANVTLLLDYVYNPYFTKKNVAKEKGIIIEEANMTLDDPYSVCFFDTLKNTFFKYKYRNLITGTKEEVNSITLEDVKLIYDTFYHPKNMFLCITGAFNPYEMAKVVEETLKKHEFLEYKNPEIVCENEPKKVRKNYVEKQINITNPIVKVQIKMEKKKFKLDDLTLKLITNLIMNVNFGATSDFNDELTTKELITSMYGTSDIYDDYLVLGLTVNTDYVDEVIKRIKEKLNNLEVNELDFKRKKNVQIATHILNYEYVEQVNSRLQENIINYNKIITNYKEILEDLTIDDVNGVVDTISLDNIAFNVFLPKENQDN